MVGLINLGAGLSQMGTGIAQAATMGEQHTLDEQKMMLANQLQEGTQTRLAGLQHGYELETVGAQGEQARQTAQTAAEAQGGQERQSAQFATTLPMSEFQQAQTKAQQTQAEAAVAEAQKPVAGPWGSNTMAMLPGSKWQFSAVTGGAPEGAPDPNSNNLTAQTGLSDNAIAVATGQLTGRYAASYRKELQDWGVKNGVNIDTLIPQAQASFNILKNNIQRNNQATILENEIQGSTDNLSPMLDAAHRGSIRFANSAEGWVAQQGNDPQAVMIADQLNRYRNEVAGYNAVAGGHLMENGTPHPDEGDFHAADSLISSGINGGGVKAIAQSVTMSAAKNSKVLQGAIDNANAQYFKLFGANYHTPQVNPTTPNPAGPAGTGVTGGKSWPSPPPGAVSDLKANRYGPDTKAHFEAMFGPGSADKYLGAK